MFAFAAPFTVIRFESHEGLLSPRVDAHAASVTSTLF